MQRKGKYSTLTVNMTLLEKKEGRFLVKGLPRSEPWSVEEEHDIAQDRKEHQDYLQKTADKHALFRISTLTLKKDISDLELQDFQSSLPFVSNERMIFFSKANA